MWYVFKYKLVLISLIVFLVVYQHTSKLEDALKNERENHKETKQGNYIFTQFEKEIKII